MDTTYRQGDVLFRKIEQIPECDFKKRANGHILEGEATGHIHRLADVKAAKVLEVGEKMYLSVTAEGGVSIVHEEHESLVLPAGDYEVIRQREYSPSEIRNVAD
jgi:hypothetical protein